MPGWMWLVILIVGPGIVVVGALAALTVARRADEAAHDRVAPEEA